MRNCIGQKFTTMEEKVILSRLLRTYEVAAHDVEFSHGMRPNIDTQSTSAFYVEKKMNICPCVPMRGSLKSFVFWVVLIRVAVSLLLVYYISRNLLIIVYISETFDLLPN